MIAKNFKNIPERVQYLKNVVYLYPKGYKMNSDQTVSALIKSKRKQLKITQPELADKAGVGLRFIREMEQGKTSLRMDKVNQVLQLFGMELGPVRLNRKKLTDEKS